MPTVLLEVCSAVRLLGLPTNMSKGSHDIDSLLCLQPHMVLFQHLGS